VELVGLPVEGQAFVDHLRAQLVDAAKAVDLDYLSNTYFNIVDGRPTLARLTKKPDSAGFQSVESALTRKLQALAQWVYFATDLIQENVRDEQLKVIKYNHLIANLLIFHNCKSMTQALKELQDEGMVLTPEILRALIPFRQHPSRFGMYELRACEAGPIATRVTGRL
jgi:hypothetical protein